MKDKKPTRWEYTKAKWTFGTFTVIAIVCGLCGDLNALVCAFIGAVMTLAFRWGERNIDEIIANWEAKNG